MGAVLAVGAATLPACDPQDEPLSEGDTEQEVELDPEDPAEADLEALVEASCEQVDQCNCGDVVFGDENCTTARTREWTDRLAYGRDHDLTYDRECVTSQMLTLPNMGCASAGSGETHLCDNFCSVFHGEQAEGAPCESFDETVSNCAQGLTCHDGVCASPCGALTGLSAGQRCSNQEFGDFDDCARGLFCDWNSSTCLRLPQLGEFCDYQCGEGLWCDYDTSTCQPAGSEGADCWRSECTEGLVCVYEGDSGPPDYTPTQTCRRPGTEGQACLDGYLCAAGLVCNGSVCGQPPLAGEPCPEGVCGQDLFCDWNINRCVAPPAGVGQPCPWGECAWGLWCDQSQDPEGECLEVRALAEACTGHSQCDSGYCPRGYCLPRPALGEDCSETQACASGLVCNGATCQLAQARGPAVCIYDGW